MNKRTIYTLPKDTELSGKLLSQLLEAHKADKAIFRKLESYVDDEPEIDRETPNDLLAIHNFAQYITDINVGYLIGNPVDYKATDNTNLDPIIENYRDQSIHDIDSDVQTDCSMFGQAFENVFVDEQAEVMSAKLSVYNTIVVYDDTFKHNKMFAIYYSPQYDDQGRELKDKFDLTIWTKTQILLRKLDGEYLSEDPEEPDSDHVFGEVPVIHYFNNKRLKGDYEPVISLIDAYNILQSDRVIDREKLVDAILAFSGMKLTPEDQEAIKDNRVLGMPVGAKAEYVIKQVNESDTDVLRKAIAQDIHKFSMTPDLTDESFTNSPSGVALLYKLLAFEMKTKKKESQFELALKERFALYVAALSVKSKIGRQVDLSKVDVVFKRSLPKNDLETSQIINNLEGLVDNETLVGQLSFVEDASVSVEKAREEQQTSVTQNDFGTGKFEKPGVAK